MLFFYQGSVDDGVEFLAKYWPEARAVSDLPLIFYKAFGLQRGGLLQVMGPGAAVCSLRAAAKGHIAGIPIGDPWQMPGLFLVQKERVLWQHDFAHIGDHPDFSKLPEQLALVG